MKKLFQAVWPACVLVVLLGGGWKLYSYNQERELQNFKTDLERCLASIQPYEKAMAAGGRLSKVEKDYYWSLKTLIEIDKQHIREAAEAMK